MAAPAISARALPIAIRLDDGFQSVIVASTNPALEIFEKTVQPGAFEGGDPIMTTTMLNQTCETKSPQRLKGVDDIVVVAAYDPAYLEDFWDMINVPDAYTTAWPDGSAQAQWAYMRRFEPSPLTKGEQPEATITFVVTNWDPYACEEACPVWQSGTGSCSQFEPRYPTD